MAEFEQAYKDLNVAQKQAVDAIDGPVLVIAGPGTGKTQLLSMRVANILHKTDTDPGNILCLTFTNFAATNMRDRLLRLVGPSSHSVMVKTFHSFAAEIMNSYPDYFWNGARLATAPDAVQLEIIQDILAGLPLDNPLALKFAGAYTMTGDVQSALKLAKEAGLTPDKLRAILDVNIAYIDVIEPQLVDIASATLSVKKLPDLAQAVEALPNQPIDEAIAPLTSLSTVIKESLRQAIDQDEDTGKTVNTGKWKRRWLQNIEGEKGMFDERNRNAWWLALADVYEKYRDELHKRGYYDYSDMIVEVISQLEQHAELRASVQERFLYVLIDEFQDTNAAQLRLAHLVADHQSSEGNPNLMAVGDDDQTIFAFNGAELNNMLSFGRSYPTAKLIVLEDNYRSTQAVLDAAKTIIEQAEHRLINDSPDISKNLSAVRPPTKLGHIQHNAYPTRQHQLSAVAKTIQGFWSERDGSIAILARGHDSLRQVAAELLRLGVPVQYEQQQNVLEHEAVVQATLIAEIAVAIGSGDEATSNARISKLLRHPMWQVDGAKLWQLAITNYSKPQWLESLLNHDDQKLQTLSHWLVWLSAQASYQPLALMMEYILGLREGEHMRSPLQDYFMKLRPLDNTYLETLSAIQLLRQLADEFAIGANATLADFARYIQLNRDNSKIIADESWFVSSETAVQLMTVHKAKGLEFDTVVIIDAIEDNWKPRRTGRKPPANLPFQPYGDTYDDYVRLMYVAATRAKHSLLVTSFYTDYSGKALLATPLVRVGFETTTIEPKDLAEAVPVLESALRWPRLTTSDEHALLSKKLQNFSLSATGLLNFLDITQGGPQHFLEHNLLRLPEAKTAALSFGTAIHSALETAQRHVNAGDFELGLVLSQYETALQAEHMLPEEFERYALHGQNVLQKLFKNPEFTLEAGSLPEQHIGDIKLGKATLNGNLDRIDLQDNSLTIVDYKTGKPLPSLTSKGQQSAIKAWKHRSQLIFYTLLTTRSPRFMKYKNVSGCMLYVEAERQSDLMRTYSPEPYELERLGKVIEAVWQHIMELDFPDMSKYEASMHGITALEDDLISGTI